MSFVAKAPQRRRSASAPNGRRSEAVSKGAPRRGATTRTRPPACTHTSVALAVSRHRRPNGAERPNGPSTTPRRRPCGAPPGSQRQSGAPATHAPKPKRPNGAPAAPRRRQRPPIGAPTALPTAPRRPLQRPNEPCRRHPTETPVPDPLGVREDVQEHDPDSANFGRTRPNLARVGQTSVCIQRSGAGVLLERQVSNAMCLPRDRGIEEPLRGLFPKARLLPEPCLGSSKS